MTIQVFVYGTLRRGEGNHRLLAGAEHLGDGQTLESFTLINLGWFPAVIVGPTGDGGPGSIRGEVYAVDDETFARLDRLEGFPSFYQREHFDVVLDDGREVSAWMYFMWPEGQRGAEVIPSGDWLDRTPAVTTDN